MIVQERKSKYRHKITFKGSNQDTNDVYNWCIDNFGPGGRKYRWRRGWINQDTTFYFKQEQDITMFLLKWG